MHVDLTPICTHIYQGLNFRGSYTRLQNAKILPNENYPLYVLGVPREKLPPLHLFLAPTSNTQLAHNTRWLDLVGKLRTSIWTQTGDGCPGCNWVAIDCGWVACGCEKLLRSAPVDAWTACLLYAIEEGLAAAW